MSENSSFEIITSQLDLDNIHDISGDELLFAISDKVAWYLEHDTNMLLSYLYRLDVAEEHVNQALSPLNVEAPHLAIARLILNRQKQRMETKQKYKVTPIEDWEF